MDVSAIAQVITDSSVNNSLKAGLKQEISQEGSR